MILSELGKVNNIARFSRLSKIYRIVKITKLARLLKTVKIKDKIGKFLTDSLKISMGVERLMLLLISFLILQHMAACIW